MQRSITAPIVKAPEATADIVLFSNAPTVFGGIAPATATVVSSPAFVESLTASGAQFGPADFDVTGNLVSVGSACQADVISPAATPDAIAFIERGGSGVCNFTNKVKKAQDAGYAAALVYGAVGNPTINGMAGDDASITISAVAVNRPTSASLAVLRGSAGAVTVTLQSPGGRTPRLTVPGAIGATTDPGVCNASLDPGMATAVDENGATLTVDFARVGGLPLSAPYVKGNTVINWSASATSRSTVGSQIVTIIDRELPVIPTMAGITVNNDLGLSTATVSVATPVATDNCPGVFAVTGTRSDGAALNAVYPLGVTSILWKTKDASNNASTATQAITVNDAEPPTLTVPTDFTVNATMPTGAVVDFTTESSDNVKVLSVDCTRVTGTVFPVGVNTNTCTASDAAGNTTSHSFVVTVLGAPEQIANLLESLKGTAIPEPYRTQLVSGLQTVLGTARSTRIACPAMDLFIRAVKARTPAYILPATSAQIVTDALRIKDVMGCPTPLI